MKCSNLQVLHFTCDPKFMVVLLILMGTTEILFSQFQTSIGYTFPSNERAARGVQTNVGSYFVLVDNNNHPNKLFNTNGDLQLLSLNAAGYLINPAKLLGQDGTESAAWMEKTSCGSGGYIIAANEDFGTGSNMLAILTDQNGNQIWSRTIGSNFSRKKQLVLKKMAMGIL